jgi:hypothetical protein
MDFGRQTAARRTDRLGLAPKGLTASGRQSRPSVVPPHCAAAVLMGSNQGAVDQDVFLIGILGQKRQQIVPNPLFCPSAEATMDVFDVAKRLRKIPPGNAGAITIENSVDKQTIIPSRRSNMPNTTRQQVFDAIPLIVSNAISQHSS